MGSEPGQNKDAARAPQSFATTRWSLVQAAAGDDSSVARRALSDLCLLYWYPLYAYVRRRGHAAEEARDLTQGFFARVLERRIFTSADCERGRFRSYLLGALKHFLSDERDRALALKRGGGRLTLSRDAVGDETRYSLEASHGDTPERLFERQWALTLIELALADVRRQFEREGKGPMFEQLKAFLTSDPSSGSQSQTAADLGVSPGALRVTVHRARRRYRDALRHQIAQTVGSPDEVDDEVRHLFGAVSR